MIDRSRMRVQRGPLAVGMSAALGVTLAALAGFFEAGWGLASAFAVLCGALAAGVVRDPDGPEIHLFLGVVMALTAGFTITHAALVISETARARDRARPEMAAIAREEVRRIRDDGAPKWALMASGVVLGAAALGYRGFRARRRG